MAKRRFSVLQRARSRTVIRVGTAMTHSFLVPGLEPPGRPSVYGRAIQDGGSRGTGGWQETWSGGDQNPCHPTACDNPVVSDTTVELAAIERGAGPAVTLIHGGVFHSG